MKLGANNSNPPAAPTGRTGGIFEVISRCPKPVLLGGLLILLATLGAYRPVFSAGFIWDDDDYVTHNQNLHDLGGLWQIWFNVAASPQYYPLVYSGFWLEYHLWGLNPVGFHLVNVLLHIAGAMLLWRVLAHLKLPGAWLAAAIFALHPLQVESVAWVTERKNVLSGVFYFSAALAYLRFSGLKNEPAQAGQRRNLYLAALLLFVGALLSKTVTCSLPAALCLVIWWKKDRLQRQDLLPLAPFFLTGIGFGLITAWIEKHQVGANGAEWSLTFMERGLIAGRALCFYAAKLVCPSPLAFIYPRWEINASLWWQWLFPATVLSVIGALWFSRQRLGKGPLVATLFFAGTLFPALGFVNVYPMRFSFVADHFQYLASAGLIALGAVLLVRLPKVLLAGVLLILVCLTWQQAGTYRDLQTLWLNTLERNPQCWMAHNNLGMVLAAQNQMEDAENHYRSALSLKHDDKSIHYNLANLLLKTGRVEEAITQYQQALQFAPDDGDSHNNLGMALFKLHRKEEAITQFRQAIQCAPQQASYHYNLGNALATSHQLEAAVVEFKQALALDPGSELIKKRLQALGVPAN